jgi:hypothetical protein
MADGNHSCRSPRWPVTWASYPPPSPEHPGQLDPAIQQATNNVLLTKFKRRIALLKFQPRKHREKKVSSLVKYGILDDYGKLFIWTFLAGSGFRRREHGKTPSRYRLLGRNMLLKTIIFSPWKDKLLLSRKTLY